MTNVALFAQIVSKLDRAGFGKLVSRFGTDKHAKGYDSWTHLISMLFCQLAKSQSVRDISNGLRSATGNLNHLGVSRAPSKSSISYQNKHRDWRLFREYYFHLLKCFGQQAAFRKFRFRIKARILLLDATTISVCLKVFDWAHYKTAKGAVKLHTLLDYEGHIPVYMVISDGKTGDNRAAFDIPLPRGCVVVADRFYVDLRLINDWDSSGALFVIRHKENLSFTVIRKNELNTDRNPHVLADEIIELKGRVSREKYPKKLRRVVVWDSMRQENVEILTNQFSWSANTVGEIYRCRWQIEIFFRDIKQLLHVKSFIGTSENAVMIQVWTAMITILILKVLKAMAQHKWYLSNLVSFIRLNLFVKIDLQQWLDEPFIERRKPPKNQAQGVLFDFG